MKNSICILLVLLSFSLLCLPAFADILPPNSHYVERCVKITNLEQYPSIVVLTQDIKLMGGDEQALSIARAGQCLPSPAYKFDTYKIYWAEKSYVDSIQWQSLKLKNASYEESSIDDSNIHFITSSIRTNGGYADNSNPATKEEISYVLEKDSAGQYGLVKQGAAAGINGTAPPGPATPSTPSKPAPSQPAPSVGDSTSYPYLLLVLVLGAVAIFIIIKSMSHAHPKSMPPAHTEPPKASTKAASHRKRA